MSNAFAPNLSYLCAERASHLTVKTYWLPVDVCGGGSLCDELGCLGHRGYTMNGVGGGADNIDDEVRVRQHRDVAAVDTVGGCIHTLRHEAFQIRVNRAVVVGDDVPTRLRLPGDARGIPAEQVGSRRIMCRPDHLLLFLREVSSEALDSFRQHPYAPVRDFDVLEYIGDGELPLLALRSFVGVRGKGGDVDKPSDAVICSCGCDHASAVGGADQEGRVGDPS